MVDDFVDGDGRRFSFYRWSEMDDATLRTFALLNATQHLREHGSAVPHQWAAIMQELHRAPSGVRPPEERLPGAEWLASEEVAALPLTPAERSVLARWSDVWDGQPEAERWWLVARCAAAHLADDDGEGVPRALLHLMPGRRGRG